MPIYRYRNLTTDETFELEQRITEPALTQHPETGDPVKRLIQPVGIAFKGSGFYVNDSRASKSASSSSSSKGDKSDKAETKPESGKAETSKTDSSSPKNDSKAAAKAESKGSSA